MGRFGIADQVADIGESITLTTVTVSSTNTRGGETVSTSDVTTTAIVEVISSEDQEVQEGIMLPEDLRAFFDEDNSNVSALAVKNRITWNSNTYEIKEVIKNQGHYEVLGSKL